MKLLITGANGYIGQAVATRLQRDGHEVTGLVRSRAAAAGLEARGIEAALGSLDDAAVLRDVVATVDTVVDTATADHAESTRLFLSLLEGPGTTFVRTSGTGVYTDLAQGELNPTVYTEDTPHTPAEVVATRYGTDLAVQRAAGEQDIRTIVIRPSMIFGDGASEQLPLLIRQALTSGTSLYVGAGLNTWGNVYLADLAEVYALALEHAPAGAIYNIAAGEATMGDIARGVAELLGQDDAVSCSPQRAYDAFGQRWVDVALSSNSRVDSSLARKELGWEPQGPALLDDLVGGSYRRLWAYKGDPHDNLYSPAS